jgi:hypothetical protein
MNRIIIGGGAICLGVFWLVGKIWLPGEIMNGVRVLFDGVVDHCIIALAIVAAAWIIMALTCTRAPNDFVGVAPREPMSPDVAARLEVSQARLEALQKDRTPTGRRV